MNDVHERFMQRALVLAAEAARGGEVPVGAVVVDAHGRIVGEGFNAPIATHDPTAHAEVQALRQAAAALGNYRLPGCTLYVTIEPCTMCAGALIHARVSRLVFGAAEPKAGAVISASRLLDDSHFNHRVEVLGGLLADEARGLMQAFFSQRRRQRALGPDELKK